MPLSCISWCLMIRWCWVTVFSLGTFFLLLLHCEKYRILARYTVSKHFLLFCVHSFLPQFLFSSVLFLRKKVPLCKAHGDFELMIPCLPCAECWDSDSLFCACCFFYCFLVWGRDPGLFYFIFCMQLTSCPGIQWKVSSFPCGSGILLFYCKLFDRWVYFSTLNLFCWFPNICFNTSLDYWTFEVSLETGKYESLGFVLQACISSLSPFNLHFHFGITLSNLCQTVAQILRGITLIL